MSKVKAHVSTAKKEQLKELINNIKSFKTIIIVSIKGLPSRQFQDIKKKIRDKAKIKIIKKSIVTRAIEESGVAGIKDLEQYVNDNCAFLYTNSDAFEISGILSKEKSPQKAKAGQEAPEDIEVKAGPTELLPGPDISALSSVGLAPKVENGKIAIMQDKVIVTKGSVINDNVASIMAKLDIIPFEVGIEPVAAFMDGQVYSDIKINSEEVVEDLLEKYSRALPFAVEIGYYTTETLDFILSKAGINASAIESLIDESATEKPAEEKKDEASEEKKEESGEEKAEENKGEAKAEEKPAEEEAKEEEKPVVEEKKEDEVKEEEKTEVVDEAKKISPEEVKSESDTEEETKPKEDSN